MADVGPNKKRIAQLLRMLGSSGGERRNAFAALERVMQAEGIGWTDIGNWLDGGDEGKFTESELQEYGHALRAEGIEAGIKIGMSRASNGGGNGHIMLPNSLEMAQYCHDHLSLLRRDKDRDFIGDMYLITQRGRRLSKDQFAYLASIYLKTR